MRWYWTLVPVSLGGCILWLAGAFGQQPAAQPAQPSAERKEPPPKADAEGTGLLKQAIQELNPDKHPWLQTAIWQQGDVQGLTFQAEGRYLTAPDHRLHLDLQVRIGDTTGQMLVVSDGSTLWESTQVGSGKPVVQKVDLKKALEALSKSPAKDQRAQFLQQQSLAGMAPLLQTIQDQMTVTHKERVRRHGRDLFKLTAVWSEETAKKIASPRGPWPALLPRQCRLYLDPQPPHWPHRFEWWGPAPPRAGDALLLQLEFRHYQLDQELTKEQVAREFTLPAEKLK
jgi:hypothetical protein